MQFYKHQSSDCGAEARQGDRQRDRGNLNGGGGRPVGGRNVPLRSSHPLQTTYVRCSHLARHLTPSQPASKEKSTRGTTALNKEGKR